MWDFTLTPFSSMGDLRAYIRVWVSTENGIFGKLLSTYYVGVNREVPCLPAYLPPYAQIIYYTIYTELH